MKAAVLRFLHQKMLTWVSEKHFDGLNIPGWTTQVKSMDGKHFSSLVYGMSMVPLA